VLPALDFGYAANPPVPRVLGFYAVNVGVKTLRAITRIGLFAELGIATLTKG